MQQITPFPPNHRRPEWEPGPQPSRPEAPRTRLRRAIARFRGVFLVGAGILLAMAALFLFDATKPPPQRLTQADINAAVARVMASATPGPSYASQAYEVIRPSLVLITAQGSGTHNRKELAAGTGVVVDEAGAILTSLHVVEDALEIRVVFADGSESPASIVASQPEHDLAVLRPEVIPDDLVPATLAGSGRLNVGDEVFAAGNPFGISNSLTGGVVSGLGREYRSPTTGRKLTDLIQFDAAVNPGNSGGPLLDRNGEVVGIVTGLINPTGQGVFIGIGFAVPIETAAGALGSPPL